MNAGLVFGLLFVVVHLSNAVDTIDKSLDTVEIKRPIKQSNPTITFSLKYYTSTKYATNGDTAPLLVHITYGGDAKKLVTDGPESFIFAVAQQLNASLLVLEHRYFGLSPVRATAPVNYNDVLDISAENAIADFTAIIDLVRKTNDRKVILSGSGYAGELATIMRINAAADKPFYASIISNAPLRLHKDGGLTLGAFNKNLDDIYVGEGCNLKKIKDAMKAINEAKRDSQEAKDILVALNLNGVGDEIADSGRKNLQRYIHKAYAGLARENLDVEHDVGKQTFKKRPLKTYCDKVNEGPDTGTGTSTVNKVNPIKLLIEAYYQKTDLNDEERHNYKELGDIRRNYIECFVTLPYQCAQGPENDIFFKICDNENDTEKWLNNYQKICGVLVPDSSADLMKGEKIQNLTNSFKYTELEKTIYIDGALDPDSIGSIAEVYENKKQYHYVIKGAAKFAHLRTPSSCDADNTKEARYRTINLLQCWLNDDTTSDKCKATNFNTELPEYVSANSETCEDQLSNYPWGRDTSNPDKGTTDKPGDGGKTSKPAGSLAASQLLVQIPLITLVSLVLLR